VVPINIAFVVIGPFFLFDCKLRLYFCCVLLRYICSHDIVSVFSIRNTIDFPYLVYLVDPKAYDGLCKLTNGKFQHMFL
jgi:hypothetical protein